MIRKASINDIVSINNVDLKAKIEPLGLGFLENEFSNNPFSYYLVYELNNMIIGYIGTRELDNSIEILNFAVLPDYQNQGYGGYLMEEVINYAKGLNKKNIILEVRKSNTRARRFYFGFGFEKLTIKHNYYDNNEDGYVLIKEV